LILIFVGSGLRFLDHELQVLKIFETLSLALRNILLINFNVLFAGSFGSLDFFKYNLLEYVFYYLNINIEDIIIKTYESIEQ